METIRRWLDSHKFTAHLLAFLLMSLPPVGMFFAARAGASGLVWMLLGLVVLGNLLAFSTP